MRPIRQLIDTRLAAQALRMQAFSDSLRQLLPPALAPHCAVSGVHEDQLILSADGASWGTQLRYLQREIVKHMNAHHGLGVSKVRVRVGSAPLRPVRASGGTPHRPAVPATAEGVLRQTARGLSDAHLAAALERLAARAGKGPKKP